jgi:ferric-chelate reductase
MGRIIFSSGLFHSAKQSNGNNTKLFDAHAEMVGSKLIRLVVPCPAHFSWKPGQTAYLTLPNVSRLPFEAHPFTIASYDAPLTTTDSNTFASATGVKDLVFLINVRNGMTKRLKEAAVAKKPLSVFVDGPYGDAHDLNCFHSCTLVAGGSGVSYTLPVLLDIIQYVNIMLSCMPSRLMGLPLTTNRNVRAMKSYCTRVLFLWTVRSMGKLLALYYL